MRARHSAAMSGENNPNFGKTIPKIIRDKISKAHKGKKLSEETKKKLSEAHKGKPSLLKGRRYPKEYGQNISFEKIGIHLTTEQRAARKKQKTREWEVINPEKIAEYDLKQLKPRALANSRRRKYLRKQAIEKLGGRCSSPNCKWINGDNSKGCTDFRILQFDHVKGGGTQDRKKGSFEGLCKEVISDTVGKYQLLCANCNWIKAFEQREFKFLYETEKLS